MRLFLNICLITVLALPLAGFHADTAQFNVECGDDALSKGLSDQALKYWAHALEVDSTYAPAYLSRGFFYLKNGRSADAVADFSRVIDLNPGEASSYVTRGLVLSQSGEKERALADFRAGCRLGDDSACSFLGDHR